MWTAGSCIDPDVCTTGATRAGTVPCEGGTWSEICVSGQWQPDACVASASPYVFAANSDGGVYAFSINQTTGALTQVGAATAPGGLGHAEATIDGKIFATASWGGYLRAFAFNPASGTLTNLGNGRSTGLSTTPSHVAFSPGASQVYVTHNSTNQISVLPFNGTPGATTFGPATEIVLSGQGVSQLLFHPTLNLGYVPCMTTQRVSQFVRDLSTGALTPATPATVALTQDARYMALHPDASTAYVLTQAGSSVHVFNIDNAGSLVYPAVQVIQAMSWSALSADIKLTPNGNFLYTTNRNAGNMTVFQVGADHRLTNVGTVSTGSSRVFAIDPSGRFAYVGTGTGIGIWAINQTSGALTSQGSVTGLGSIRGIATRSVPN